MTGSLRIKKISLLIISGFYILAGVNHFVNPDFYYPMIPDYFPFPIFINAASGLLEIALGILILWKTTRRLAAYGIMIMLLAFVPAHVHFIILGGCVADGLCVPMWLAWFRLIPIHPLLIMWAWWHSKG